MACSDRLDEFLAQFGGFTIDSDSKQKTDEQNFDFRTLFLNRRENLKMVALKPYDVPADILNVEMGENDTFLEAMKGMAQTRSNQTDYVKAYSTMIYLEEAAQSLGLLEFNQTSLRLSRDAGHMFLIKNDKKVEKINEAIGESVLDYFSLKPVECETQITIPGRIQGANKDHIFLEIFDERIDFLLCNYQHKLFDINFHINRTPFQLQHNALEYLENHDLFPILANNQKYDCVENETETDDAPSYVFSGTLAAKLNKEQKAAVGNIVNATSFPLPYLLFGPAGTGKTGTLAAAVEEIVKSTAKCVLVCANSNAACDEITERLLQVLKEDEMYRMYAKSYDKRKIRDEFKEICNLRGGEFHFPSLRDLYKFRVLICTLSTSGCLTRAREDVYFRSNHFSHVFIDECASTHETVSMIPIAGLCTSSGRINSSIVLAGDPKQLDAVTRSKNAIKLGFKTSFMEHLFNRPLYQRNPETGNYNPKYITQLVKNYRSHSAILHIPNMLFYENKLEAKAPADITDWFIGSEMLPTKTFPIIFKCVDGFCKQSHRDFSMFNTKEVNVVIEFIKELLNDDQNAKFKLTQSDIGVVTPYKLQCKILSRNCRRHNLNDITVGTAEVFQGQERPVMIVSTVRTGGILGFVNDPRRLNVIITRAKCLLIIVGDRDTLSMDPNWRILIDYCDQNQASI